ncbi:MAG: TolC family protein [Phycisphaeraceae bacterium]
MARPMGLPPVAAPARPSEPVDVMAPQGPLTLEACLNLALAHNPGLMAAADDAGRAAAEADLARSIAWPKLDAVSGYTHTLDDQRLVSARFNGEPGVFASDLVSADLVLTMPLFTGGQITHQIKAAELLQAAASHRLSRNRHELAFNVTSLFYSMLAQRRFIESVELSRQAIDQQRQRIRQLIDAEKAANVDLLRTEVRLANIDQQLIAERNRLLIQQRTMGTLVGLAARSVEAVGELEADEMGQTGRPDTPAAMAQRQDYLAAGAGVEAERHRLEAAKGARWPQVNARAAYGGRYGIDAQGPAGADDLEDVAAAGVFATIPLLDGGEIAANVLRQRFALSGQRQRLRELELRIDLEVQSAWLNMQSASQRIAATTAAVKQADEGLRIEREKYDQGKGTITDVLDAQSALLEAQTTYYRALADRLIALAQLKLATGEAP